MISFKDNMKLNIKKTNYIIVFFVIYLSSSFYTSAILGRIKIILSIMLCGFTIILNYKNIRFNIYSLYFLLFILISSILTIIFNHDNIYNYIIFWIFFIIAYMVYSSISLREFIIIYNNIMYYLCIFSLITFAILNIYPSVFNFLPLVTNNAGLTVRNAFFSVVYDSNYFNRNFGLFWEPGAYQTFINLAIFFQVFIIKDFKFKYIGVFLATIFTTFSTTGYLASIFILFILLFLRKTEIYEEVKRRKKFILIIIIGGILIFSLLPEIIKFRVFGKLKVIFNPELSSKSRSFGSTTTRTDSIKYPLMWAFTSPLFGIGFSNLAQKAIDFGFNMVTCTPVNWFALFGLLPGMMFNFCILQWTRLVKSNLILKLLLFIFLLLIVISENYNRNMFYLMFLFYSFDIKTEDKYSFTCE